LKGLKIPVSLVRFRVRAPLFKEPSLWLGFCFSAFIKTFTVFIFLYLFPCLLCPVALRLPGLRIFQDG
ncbi:hypothetical protein, partial [Enterobacter rongchengensis]